MLGSRTRQALFLILFFGTLVLAAPLTAGAEVSVVGTSVKSARGGGHLQAARPAGTEPGDVLLAQVDVVGRRGRIDAPAGWHRLRRDRSRGKPYITQVVYFHVATPGDPWSYRWKVPARAAAVGVLAYRGVLLTDPVQGARRFRGRVTVPSPARSVLVVLLGSRGRATRPQTGLRERYDVHVGGRRGKSGAGAEASDNLTPTELARLAAKPGSSGNGRRLGQQVKLTPAPDFALSLSPGALTVGPATPGSATLDVGSLGSFAESVDLTVTGLPAGASATVTPSALLAPGSAVLAVTVDDSTPAGTYAVQVAGTSGALLHSLTLSLSVGAEAAPPPPPPPSPTLGASLPALLPASSGTVHYVSTAGSDSNPGTLASPWKTVQKALSSLLPGETALVRGGTYSQNLRMTRAGTASAPITVAAYPGEVVVLHPSASSPTYPLEVASGAAFVRFQGFVIENAVGPSTTNVYVDGTAHDIEVSQCEVRNSQRQGFFIDSTTRNIHVLGCSIHDNGNVSNPQQDHGIYVEGRDQLIANCVIYGQPHGFGVQVYPNSDRVTVVDNTIVGNKLGGVVIGGETTTANSTLVANNVLAYNSGFGIGSYWGGPVGVGNVAHDNLGWGNGGGDFPSGPDGAGIAFSSNVVADPLFVDRAAEDFHLKAGSPAIDRALADLALPWDVGGGSRPSGPLPDLGAYEH